MRSSILAPLFALGLLSSLGGLTQACSANETEEEIEDALVKGEASGAADDNVVLLVRNGKAICTATLVAPGLLVTAQHCVGQHQSGKMTKTFDPAEITVRLGATPGEKAAAVATKIYTPRLATTPPTTTPPPTATDERSLASMDLAVILVQSLDTNFDKLRPRRMRDKAIAEADSVSVVGWNATGADVKLANLKRLKRTNVDVLADATQQTSVSAPSDATISTSNKVREFVTEAVACQGDDGAPAFDKDGNLAGIVAAVVGPCAAGSLSTFTDVGAHRSFIQGVITDIAKLGCSSDAKCAAASAGTYCDTATFTCGQGCRVGSATCASGTVCAAPSETAGVVGACRTGTATTAEYDAGPSGSFDAGVEPTPIPTPSGDAGTATSNEGCKDATCGGTTTSPKVCDAKTQACVAGCRVGASPSMCGASADCKASATDPTIGTCAAASVTAPAAPTLSPPARPTEAASGQAGSGLSPSDDNGDGGAKKKTKNAAKETGGCAVSPGMTSDAARGSMLWLGLGAVIALAARVRVGARGSRSRRRS